MRETYQLGGLGVVGHEILGETNCGPNATGLKEVDLMGSIGGQVVARLEVRGGRNEGCQSFLVQDGESERLSRGWDAPEIEYEALALVYYEARNEFARVFEHTIPPGVWLRISDMPEGRLRPWAEVMIGSRRTYVSYDGHALHLEPSEDSIVLATLRDRQVHETQVHQLIPTGESSGDWGEFEVIEFDGEWLALARTREPSRTGFEWKGWLRLVNSAGAPEFWYFTRD